MISSFPKLDITHFSNLQSKNKRDQRTAIRGFLSQHEIPHYIELVKRDNLLTLNLQNDDCLDILYDTIRSSKSVIIQEYMKVASIVQDERGESYAHEFVLSFNFDR